MPCLHQHFSSISTSAPIGTSGPFIRSSRGVTPSPPHGLFSLISYFNIPRSFSNYSLAYIPTFLVSLSHFGILIWLNHKPSSTCLFAYFHLSYYQMLSPFFIRVTGLAAYSPKKNESEERTATTPTPIRLPVSHFCNYG